MDPADKQRDVGSEKLKLKGLDNQQYGDNAMKKSLTET